jgi:phospholipase C
VKPAGAYSDRCGPGPRLPLLVISPYAKRNYVSHVPIEQASILRFIEDNWSLGRLGDQSFDARAGSLADLFDFSRPNATPLLLDGATGEPS